MLGKCKRCYTLTHLSPDNIYLYINVIILVFLLLTLNIFHTFFSVFIVDFGQVNDSWEISEKYGRTDIGLCKELSLFLTLS